MRNMRRLGLSAIAAMGLSAAGCSSNSVEGTIDTYEFGDVQTAFFLFEGDNAVTILLADYAATCEDLNDDENETEEGTPYGAVFLIFGKRTADGLIERSTETGEYPAATGTEAEGDLIFGGFAGYEDDTGDGFFESSSGKLTLDTVDLTSTIEGSFEMTLTEYQTGTRTASLSGKFVTEYCDTADEAARESLSRMYESSMRAMGR